MIAATFHSECNLPLISRIAKCKLTITDQHIYRQRHTWRLKMRARKDRHAVTPNAIVWGSIDPKSSNDANGSHQQLKINLDI